MFPVVFYFLISLFALKTLSGLKMLLLLSWWIITGVMAEDSPVTYYQLRNSSVCLHVRTPPPYKNVVWKLREKVFTSDTVINPKYAGKVSSPGNQSLCINKLMDTDAGIYEFSFVDSAFIAVSERHQVIVEEPVPKPVIITSALHSNLSAGLCNITVNCSIHDDWLWSICDGDGCRDAQKSFSKVNITISTDNSTVVCSGENHVSKNNDSRSTKICFTKSNPEKKEEEALSVLYLVIGILFIICVIISIAAKKFCSATFSQHQAERPILSVIESQVVEIEQRSGPRDSTSSSSQAEPSYENVDITQSSQYHTLREGPCSKENQVDTVYSILQMPNVTVSPKTQGHGSIQETLASASASVDETQQPMQVDTVYSMLQKPKNNSTIIRSDEN